MRFLAPAIPFMLLAAGCAPTVQLATDKPIEINMNIKIEHEIRIQVDEKLDGLIAEDHENF